MVDKHSFLLPKNTYFIKERRKIMNYLVYPLKVMNITQGYDGSLSHRQHNLGNPKDYPIDDNGASSKKDAYFYCPCDEMVIKKIYGVGTSAGNTLWLESTTKVTTPSFYDYVGIIIVHPNDADFKGLKVGQKFKRGEKIILEGDDGKATGYHFHMAVGRGKFLGTGWIKNSDGIWVIRTTEGAVKPQNAFFIDPDFTTVKNTGGIKFTYLQTKPEEFSVMYVTKSLNVRYGPGTNYQAINSLPAGTKVNVYATSDSWSRISEKEWVSHNFLTATKPRQVYETKVTTAEALNVRQTPNGLKVKEKSPLPNNTLVAVMATKGNWTKINTDRWVYSAYLA